MNEYLIIPQPDPMDELPEGVRGWLALNAMPLERCERVRVSGKPYAFAAKVLEEVYRRKDFRGPPGSRGREILIPLEKEPRHISWRASVHEPLPKPCLMHGSQHNVGECAWSRGELLTVDEAIQAYDQAKDTE